jgi:membrane associated rhomboid family serine protease
MIPLRDTIRPSKTPYVNYFLIGVNLVVFAVELLVPDLETFIRTWALIPVALTFLDPSSLARFISSMFLHAGWLHIISNMLFLHVFGDNVEGRLGHLRYLVCYLIWGVVAALAQLVFSIGSTIPLLGASGAVAGVMGAYFVFFKHSSIETLVPTYFGFLTSVELPAPMMLFYWLITQIFSGSTAAVVGTAGLGGVAWFAHIGGFVGGWLSARLSRQGDIDEPIAIEW